MMNDMELGGWAAQAASFPPLSAVRALLTLTRASLSRAATAAAVSSPAAAASAASTRAVRVDGDGAASSDAGGGPLIVSLGRLPLSVPPLFK